MCPKTALRSQMRINWGCYFVPKMDFGIEFRKPNPGFRIISSKIPCVPTFRQNEQFWLFSNPNWPKNKFWGRNFKNVNPVSESAPPRYHVCHFSVKTDNFEFFGLNLGKLPNYMQYIGFNNVEGIVESWIEINMSRMEGDGARWRWVHVLAIHIGLIHNKNT